MLRHPPAQDTSDRFSFLRQSTEGFGDDPYGRHAGAEHNEIVCNTSNSSSVPSTVYKFGECVCVPAACNVNDLKVRLLVDKRTTSKVDSAKACKSWWSKRQ